MLDGKKRKEKANCLAFLAFELKSLCKAPIEEWMLDVGCWMLDQL